MCHATKCKPRLSHNPLDLPKNKSIFDPPAPGFDDPRRRGDEVPPPPQDPRVRGGNDPRVGGNDPRVGGNDPRVGGRDPRVGGRPDPRVGGNDPRTGGDQPRSLDPRTRGTPEPTEPRAVPADPRARGVEGPTDVAMAGDPRTSGNDLGSRLLAQGLLSERATQDFLSAHRAGELAQALRVQAA